MLPTMNASSKRLSQRRISEGAKKLTAMAANFDPNVRGRRAGENMTLPDIKLSTRQLVLQNDKMATLSIAADNVITKEKLIEQALRNIAKILGSCVVEKWEYDWGLQRVWPLATLNNGTFSDPVAHNHPAVAGIPAPKSLVFANSRAIHRTRTYSSRFDQQPDVDDELFKYYHRLSGHDCFLHFPLVRGRVVSGSIVVLVPEHNPSAGSKIELAHAVANRLMSNLLTMELTVKSSRLLRQKQRLEYRESLAAVGAQRDMLTRMLLTLPKRGGLHSSVEQMLQETCQGLAFHRGYISRHVERDDSHDCIYEVHSERPQKDEPAQDRIVIQPSDRNWVSNDCPFWDNVRDTLQPQMVDIEKLNTNRYGSFVTWHRLQRHRIVLCAPLMRVKRAIGCIVVGSTSPDFGSTQNLDTLNALARHASLAIRISDLADETQAVAVRGERSRIARDIHDNLAQFFTGIKIQCDAAMETQEKSDEPIDQYLKRILQMATEGVQQARQTVGLMSIPGRALPTVEGIVLDTLHRFCDGTPLKYKAVIDSQSPALTEHYLDELQSIVREAISNVQKHAKASMITISTRWLGTAYCLQIKDDGQGFNLNADGLDQDGQGLQNMKYRANHIGARFQIDGHSGNGTTIILTLQPRSEQ